ncbi:hypothetical protein ABI59_12050 [Acidobacteria bacterium Mor1]|nr:hypothetical protein ABI59_12050 [Acidobacteria bacterium Mor1]
MPLRGILAVTLCLGALTGVAATSGAEGESRTRIDPHDIPRVEATIEIDGKLDDAAWENALVLELPYEVWPGDNTEAPVRTVALLAYDGDSLYAGFRAHDPEPDKIRARISDRDRAFQDDFVGIVVDTFNDERRAYEFFSNALGVQMDLIQDDVNNNEDASWDAIWTSAGHVNETGYEVEMAIPYTSLRFQRGDGEQIWGLDLVRIYPRDRRRTLALNSRDRDINCYLCQVAKIAGFDGAEPGKNLEIVPTVTALRSDSIDSFPEGELTEGDPDYEPGITARWGMTPNLTLSGTVNPDFSQVEADVAQLNVNEQFALFFPERRPFFLEGADFFDTPFRAVNTRSVADPEWGGKLTGKEGKNAIGTFIARDNPRGGSVSLIPGSQQSRAIVLDGGVDAGVFRYRRDLPGNATLGGLVTAREGADYHNRVVGIDGLLRPTEKDRIAFQFLSSSTRYPDQIVADFNAGLEGASQPDLVSDLFQQNGSFSDRAMLISYRHSVRDWSARANYVDYGENFRADLGFIPQVNFRQAVFGGDYTFWQDDEDSKIVFYRVGGDWDQAEDQQGRLIERESEGWFQFSGPLQSFFFFGGGERERVYNTVSFDQSFVSAFYEIRPTGDLYVNVDFAYSDREDRSFVTVDSGLAPARQGSEYRWSSTVAYNLGRHLKVDLFHNHRELGLPQGTAFEADLTELRAVYQFNVRTFIRAIIQRGDVDFDPSLYPACTNGSTEDDGLCPQDESRTGLGQFLFSYKLNPQTALFLGYNEQRLGLDDSDFVRTDRTFFLKIGYAWVM